SGAEKLLQPLFKEIDVERFSDFQSNPQLTDILAGIVRFKQSHADIVIVVGGGSSIDVAKSINILAHQTSTINDIVKGKVQIEAKKRLPLIAMPTTAGTGSETTHFSVIYIDHVKYSLAHPYILPDYAIADVCLVKNMPKYLSASTGFDALAQAIESYWAVGSTEESKQYAKQAIEIILNNFVDSVHNPTNITNRRNMVYAAHLAGQAINISKTTAPHALSYILTTHWGIPHGHAVALTLGKFFIINANQNFKLNDKRGSKYVQKTLQELISMLGCNTPKRACSFIEKVMLEVGLEVDFLKLGFNPERDIHILLNNINLERISNNPVYIDIETIKNVFKY
ncbi:MAG: alcohol dehydrogenase, partial [Candidatus Parabeggiatoa sp. nov. 3]